MNGIREQLLSLLAFLKAQPHEPLIKGWQEPLVLSSMDFGNHLELKTIVLEAHLVKVWSKLEVSAFCLPRTCKRASGEPS